MGGGASKPKKESAAAAKRRQASMDTEAAAEAAAQAAMMKVDPSEGSMSPTPSDISSHSRTPSPMANRGQVPEFYDDGTGNTRYGGNGASSNLDPSAKYAEIILDYFISESTTVPSLLINPPMDFDANMSIDEDEHTALHWACAMGRIRVVKLLLSAGADVFRVNNSGQTALMRASMFANNYDLRKFPELFELLHRSILNIDRNDRTVFHHVVDLALSRAKPHPARYYMETMITRLAEYGSQLADILNFQDDEGETPLTMAARARSKRLVRLLLEHGADPKIRNKDGKNAEDYIVEDERFRASPKASTNTALPSTSANSDSLALPGNHSSIHSSESGQRAGGKALNLMSSLLINLAECYDSELSTVDKKLNQAHSLLNQIQLEIKDSSKLYEALMKESTGNENEKNKVKEIEKSLKSGVNKRDRETLETEWKEIQENVKKLKTDDSNKGVFDQTTGVLKEGQSLSNESLAKNRGNTRVDPAILLISQNGNPTLASLKSQIQELKSKRSSLLANFLEKEKESGTGKKMQLYKRIISGCGGDMGTDNTEAVVQMVCDILDQQSDEGNGNGHSQDTANLLQSAIRPGA